MIDKEKLIKEAKDYLKLGCDGFCDHHGHCDACNKIWDGQEIVEKLLEILEEKYKS